MADRGEHALDRVGRTQVVPSKARRPLIRSMKWAQPEGCEGLGGKVEEGPDIEAGLSAREVLN